MKPEDITPAKAKQIREDAGLSRSQFRKLTGLAMSTIQGKEHEYPENKWTGYDKFAYWAVWKLFGKNKSK